MNTLAYAIGISVAGSLGGLAGLVCADALAVRLRFRWTALGWAIAALCGAVLGAAMFHTFGHLYVLCDLRTFHAAQHCAIVWR